MTDIDGLAAFRCQSCPDCGYSLQGLESATRCPECGCDVGPDVLVVWGYPLLFNETSRMTQTPEQEWRAGATAAAVAVIVGIVTAFNQFVIGLLFVGIGVGIYFVANRWRRMRVMGRGTHQLRITPHGLRVRRGVGTVRLRPWAANMLLHVQHRSPFGAMIRIDRGFVSTGAEGLRFRADFDTTVTLVRHIQSLIPVEPST